MYSFFRVLTWIVFIGACFLVFGNPDVFGKYPAHVKLISLLLIFVPLLIVKSIVTSFSGTNIEPPTKIEANVVKPVSVSPKTESSVSSLSSNEIKSKTEPIPPGNSKNNMSTPKPEIYTYQELESRYTLIMSRAQSGLSDVSEIINLARCFRYEYDRTNGHGLYILRCAELYKVATEHGSAEAQFHLAMCYLRGEGVPRDYEEAMKRIWIGAHEGDSISQNYLGLLYAKHRDSVFERSEFALLAPEPDIIEAYAWMNLAGAKYKGFRENLENIARRLTPEQILAAQSRSKEILAGIEARIAEKKKTGKK